MRKIREEYNISAMLCKPLGCRWHKLGAIHFSQEEILQRNLPCLALSLVPQEVGQVCSSLDKTHFHWTLPYSLQRELCLLVAEVIGKNCLIGMRLWLRLRQPLRRRRLWPVNWVQQRRSSSLTRWLSMTLPPVQCA